MSVCGRPLNRVIVQGGRVVRIEEWRQGEWSFWRWLVNGGGREVFRSRLMVDKSGHRECDVAVIKDGEFRGRVNYSSIVDSMEAVIRHVCCQDAEGYVKAFQMENPDAVELCQMFPRHNVVFQPQLDTKDA